MTKSILISILIHICILLYLTTPALSNNHTTTKWIYSFTNQWLQGEDLSCGSNPCNSSKTLVYEENYACSSIFGRPDQSSTGQWNDGRKSISFQPALAPNQKVTQVNMTLFGRFQCTNYGFPDPPSNVWSIFVGTSWLATFEEKSCLSCSYCGLCQNCMERKDYKGVYIPSGYWAWSYDDTDLHITVDQGAICLGRVIFTALVEEYLPAPNVPQIVSFSPNASEPSGTAMTLEGVRMSGNSSRIWCGWRVGNEVTFNWTYEGNVSSSNKAICQSPPLTDVSILSMNRVLYLQVSTDEENWSNTVNVPYTYTLEILNIEPKKGDYQHVTVVTVSYAVNLEINNSSDIAKRAICKFGLSWAAATSISIDNKTFQCSAPVAKEPGSVKLSISLFSGQSDTWSNPVDFIYDKEPDDGFPKWVLSLVSAFGVIATIFCLLFIIIAVVGVRSYLKMRHELKRRKQEERLLLAEKDYPQTGYSNIQGRGPIAIRKHRPMKKLNPVKGAVGSSGGWFLADDGWELNYNELEIDINPFQDDRPHSLGESGGESHENTEIIPNFLGKGAFGVVMKGRYRGTQVAIKSFLSDSRNKQDEIDLWRKEMDILSSLRHPNIVLLIGGCLTPSGVRCIVTEFVERGSLRDIITRHPEEIDNDQYWRRILKISLKSALGVSYLHGKAIVHRDLKSANILVDKHWSAKICDFGLSRPVTVSTMTGFMGTLRWLAPECLVSGIGETGGGDFIRNIPATI
eukprot:TRINITY_DN7400_c0_g1_i2.p1 TRINITY_DN7400_c0_g1~~TRINITY_DN7400_c0_g1_i2.p1  ORF type:complete len:741 (-),score=79.09 TRINITY_DN7400_c0_g1_i2:91-2313(-)